MKNKWLIFCYKLPSTPSKKRVYVWRKLKDFGAVYLQQGVALLPQTQAMIAELQQLRQEVLEMEGEASIADLSFINEEDEHKWIAEFHQARNLEYAEICEQCERLIYELDRETEKGKFTFAEIEENEEDLAKILRWLDKVTGRDFFDAPGKSDTLKIIDKASERLNQYTEEVYKREI